MYFVFFLLDSGYIDPSDSLDMPVHSEKHEQIFSVLPPCNTHVKVCSVTVVLVSSVRPVDWYCVFEYASRILVNFEYLRA